LTDAPKGTAEMIIHLNGWPGVGKQTIGRVLARRLGARFIHNHLLHDVAIVCASIDDPDRWTVYESVRRAAYEALAKRPASEIFVMTNALCRKAPREQEAWQHVVAWRSPARRR
jgi:gluconate kinase